jgi:arylsulfatase A-like enzyme
MASSVAPAASSTRSVDPDRRYNVVLILVDSLRADMPWNGYTRDVAPRLSEFAKAAVSYSRAYSISSYTAKSVASLLAGRYPSEMKRDGRFFTRFDPEDALLVSERMQQAGRRTLGGHAHGYFMPALGMNQGFDDWKLLPGASLEPVESITSEPLTKLAVSMLQNPENTDQRDGKRFFAYFHYLDPHHTYEKHPGHPDFGNTRRDLYDHEVHYTDHWVGELLRFIDSAPWSRDTAVIVSADHGEGFGEHGHFRHGYELWESVTRVPLLNRVPEVAPARIDAPRSQIDLAPTMAQLIGAPFGEPFRGRSLVPELLGERPEARRVVLDLPRCDIQDRRRAVIAENGYKILAFGDDVRFELYDLRNDPNETSELSTKEPEMLETMKRIYRDESAKIPTAEVTGPAALKGAPPGRRW